MRFFEPARKTFETDRASNRRSRTGTKGWAAHLSRCILSLIWEGLSGPPTGEWGSGLGIADFSSDQLPNVKSSHKPRHGAWWLCRSEAVLCHQAHRLKWKRTALACGPFKTSWFQLERRQHDLKGTSQCNESSTRPVANQYENRSVDPLRGRKAQYPGVFFNPPLSDNALRLAERAERVFWGTATCAPPRRSVPSRD
ncbi:hypothetical protein FHT86_000809 [Rhizobium sp. BK313]|nr:hypothetical protein [Rhizobium sp. BK313]